jgi:broad specificity phosphatase PhoE
MSQPHPRLFLIRHGNTEWSEIHRFTGRTDLPLNARGEENARGLVARLSGISFDHIFTSPLQRARKTCELAGLSTTAKIDPDLMEWNYGQIEGRFSAEVHKERPDWVLFRDGAPGGESPIDIAMRADRFIAKARQLGGNSAAFTSGHIGRVIGARWLAFGPEAAGKLLLSTAGVCILSYEHDEEHPAIEVWNNTGKLSC